MNKATLSRPAREVISRGQRQMTDLRDERRRLERRLRDPRNRDRRRDVESLDTLKFHEKVIEATLFALEASTER